MLGNTTRLTRFSVRTLLSVVAIVAIAIVVLKNYYGPTLDDRLRTAAVKGNVRAANWCLMWGADINHGDWTPIMHAAFNNRAEMVQFLIERGAELDHAEYHDSYTALRLAEFEGHWEIVKILAKGGASDHIDDGYTWYVINYARHAGREDVVDALGPWHDANGTIWEQRQEIDDPPPR